MKNDESFGVIPLCKKQGQWHVFLVRHHAGHWGFPKGHAEEGETPQEVAFRELKEETALHVIRLFKDEPLKENYMFTSQGVHIHKTVHYFPAEVDGIAAVQLDEISDGKWVLFKEAPAHLTFHNARDILEDIAGFLE